MAQLQSTSITGSLIVTGGITGSFSGSIVAPGSNTQVLYNNSGVISADSGFVYSSGNVGIGTTSPTSKLTVNGNTHIIGPGTPGSGAGMELQYSSNTSYIGSYDRDSSVYRNLFFYSADTIFENGGTERMRITSAGNVGIGNTSPAQKLHVIGNTAVTGFTSTGGRKLSLGILDLNSGDTPTQIRINTTIPLNSPSADFTVNIKGFRYGAPQMVSLSIGWHYYLGSFYNETVISNGAWKPTVTLAQDANGYVVIHLSSPGYWPKLYVESLYSSAYGDIYSSGWTFTDANLSDCTNVEVVPYQPLATDISGNAGSTSAVSGTTNYIPKFTSSTAIGNSVIYENSSNIGIGATSPSAKLYIAAPNLGTSVGDYSLNSIHYNSNGNNEELEIKSVRESAGSDWTHGGKRIQLRIDATYMGYMQFNGSGNQAGISFGTGTTTSAPGNVAERMRITNAGLIGIGTTNPNTTVHISAGDSSYTLYGPNATWGAYLITGAGPNAISNGTCQVISTNGNLHLDSGTAQATYINAYSGTNTLINPDGGFIGIGTYSPQKKLDVVSSANDFVTVGAATAMAVGQWTGIHFGYRENNTSYRKSAIVFERTDLTSANAQGKVHILNGPQAGGGSATLSDAKLTIAENGNVGIGTTSPSNILNTFIADGSGGFSKGIRIQTGDGSFTSGHGGMLEFQNEDVLTAGIRGVRESGWGSGLVFYVHNTSSGNTFGSTFVERMRINESGNVGIGTASPSYTLDVNGTGRFSGVIVGTNTVNTNQTKIQIASTAASNKLGFSGGANNITEENLYVWDFTAGASAGISFQYNGIVNATTFVGALSGNATTATNLSTNRTNWNTNGTITAVVGQLAWKNYGNNHTIFDASNSTTPGGGATSNTNPDVAWSSTYPTLMGWNGSSTYGVRVDSARTADSTSAVSGTTNYVAKFTSGTAIGNSQIFDNGTNVGIGTTAPSQKLHIVGTNDANNGITLQNTNASGNSQVRFLNTSGTERAAITYVNSADAVYHYTAAGGNLFNLVGTNVGIGTTTPGAKLEVVGTFRATTKSFIIDHPTKENKKLQYGVLEGPEHSVYVRGKLTNTNVIQLPDYWHALVHEDSITVNLTAIGKKQDLWVEEITDTHITVASETGDINCFYAVFAERKDVEKLVTEFDKE